VDLKRVDHRQGLLHAALLFWTMHVLPLGLRLSATPGQSHVKNAGCTVFSA